MGLGSERWAADTRGLGVNHTPAAGRPQAPGRPQASVSSSVTWDKQPKRISSTVNRKVLTENDHPVCLKPLCRRRASRPQRQTQAASGSSTLGDWAPGGAQVQPPVHHQEARSPSTRRSALGTLGAHWPPLWWPPLREGSLSAGSPQHSKGLWVASGHQPRGSRGFLRYSGAQLLRGRGPRAAVASPSVLLTHGQQDLVRAPQHNLSAGAWDRQALSAGGVHASVRTHTHTHTQQHR